MLVSVAAGNHVHTAVLHSRVIESNPAAKDSRLRKGPTIEILMESEMAVILRRFRDDMIMPQPNLRRLQKRLSDASNQRVPYRLLVALISLPHVHILSENSRVILGFFDCPTVPYAELNRRIIPSR